MYTQPTDHHSPQTDQYEFEKKLQLKVNELGIPCRNIGAKVAHVLEWLQQIARHTIHCFICWVIARQSLNSGEGAF